MGADRHHIGMGFNCDRIIERGDIQKVKIPSLNSASDQHVCSVELFNTTSIYQYRTNQYDNDTDLELNSKTTLPFPIWTL